MPLSIKLALLLLCCSMLISCSSTTDSPDSVSDSGPTEEVTDPPAIPEAAREVVAQGPGPAPQEPLSMDDQEDPALQEMLSAALDHLDELSPYRFQTTVLFTDEEEGETAAGSIEMSGAVSGADRMHLVWADLEEDEVMEMILIQDEAWMKSHGEWEAVPVMVAEALVQGMLIYAPWTTWDHLLNAPETEAVYLGLETIEGVRAHHYRTMHHMVDRYWEGAILDAEEEIWIAEDGYPVRYAFTASGVDESGASFSLSWLSTITDVGVDLEVLAPE
ncbi:MAG TPA: hypothetical protein ENN96_01555 [Candidatus Acetothermia bacterium]|nr:hypothetical protein [Candidatus Acetothermia bacterium]